MVKYLLCLVTVICFASNVSSQYVEIKCDKPVLIYNNHVGNEWAHAFELDGKYASIYNPFLVETSSAYKLKFVTSEAKEKYPDASSAPMGIDPAKLEWEKLYSKTLELIVTERNGQYAGNTAKWQVTIHFRKIQGKT